MRSWDGILRWLQILIGIVQVMQSVILKRNLRDGGEIHQMKLIYFHVEEACFGARFQKK